VTVEGIEEHLEGGTVEDIFSWMDLEANIDPDLIEGIKNRTPALREFTEGLAGELCRSLGPWVDEGPCEGTRKGDVRSESEALRRFSRKLELLRSNRRSRTC
jgi:hypothetical protein